MDLVFICGGDSSGIAEAMDLLALGVVGLLLALKWHESRWLSTHLIAWLLSSILIDLAPDATPVPAQIATVIRSSPSVIVCGLVALILPLLAPAPNEWQIVFPHRDRRRAAH